MLQSILCVSILSIFHLSFYSIHLPTVKSNQGLWDQNMALRFLNEIGESITGSKQITLMGSSSGGWAVGFHVFSPQSQNLFQRAM